MEVKKRIVNVVFYNMLAIVVFALLYLYLQNTMFGASELGKDETISPFLIALLGLIPLGFVIVRGHYPNKGYAKPFVIFMLMVYCLALLHPLGSRLYVVTILLPAIFFLFSYNLDSCISSRFFLIYIVLLMALLALYFFFNYAENLVVEIQSRTMGAYTFLFILPFIFCLEKRIFRILGLVLVFSTLVFSLKRGGIVSYAVGLMVYLFVKYLLNTERKTWGFIFLVVAIVAAICGFSFFDNQVDNQVTERFMDIQEDGGSHRMDLYKRVWQMIEQSSIIEFLFGHGWDSVIKNNPMQYSAHNEFLEVLYDTGVFTLIALVIFVISIIKYNWYLIKTKSKMAAPLSASLALFLVNSTISHTLLYTKYIVLLSLFWGFVLAERKKEKMEVQCSK